MGPGLGSVSGLRLGFGLACGVAHVGRGEDVHVDDQVRIQLLEGHLVRVRVRIGVRVSG